MARVDDLKQLDSYVSLKKATTTAWWCQNANKQAGLAEETYKPTPMQCSTSAMVLALNKQHRLLESYTEVVRQLQHRQPKQHCSRFWAVRNCKVNGKPETFIPRKQRDGSASSLQDADTGCPHTALWPPAQDLTSSQVATW